MKYFASLCALVLAGSMPGFAVSAGHTSHNPQNQLHFKPTGRRAKQLAARDAKFAARNAFVNQTHTLNQPQGPTSKIAARPAQPHAVSASARNVHRRTANPPTGKVGFLGAAQIPAGGESDWLAVAGDFNGDGKTDVASEVYGYDSNLSSYTYAISVVLNNGNGTFQAPVLTPITDTCAAVLSADLNGDGKTDLIVAHAPNQCGNSNTVPTFEAWISNGDGTFTPSSNVNNSIPTTGAAGGTIADVNGDGKLDLVIVDDGNPANVWTFLGNGDGTFQPYSSVALSGEVGYNVVIADLNGDGILDIADNDYNTNYLTVYLATSTTTYGPAATYLTPDNNYNACTLTAGDLNGDGQPELINTNDCYGAGNDITVYVNNGGGTGTFGGSTLTGVYYNSAMSGGSNSVFNFVDTTAVTIADVNGDGKADIVATNYDSGDVTILFGNGDGTVNEPTKGFSVGGYPSYPALVADFNGDGFADIIVPDYEFSFAYLRGYGDGTFRSALNYYPAENGSGESYSVATGDFNKDGHPDFVIANYCGSCVAPIGITVFLSNPDGSLQAGMNFENGTETYYFVAVADFNQDGNPDVVATDVYTGTATIFYGDGTGNFTAGTPFNTDLASNDPYGVFIGDFNKDGYPDLAVANWTGNDVSILLNDRTGNFPLPVPVSLSGGVWQGGAVADLGNGNPDLVLPYYYGSAVAVLVGDGLGNFTEQDVSLGAGSADAVAIADFGNGKPDIAVTLSGGGGQDIAVLIGNGDGTFQTPATLLASSLQDYNLNTPNPQYIQATDVDGDGKMDLVYVNEYYGTVGVLFGQGNGTFFDPVEYPVDADTWSLVVADVNGDGAPDVVTSSVQSALATVLLNNNGTSTVGSYTIGTNQQGATIPVGQSAQFILTITPNNHYNGTVTLSCPTGLPALATCSFSPSAIVTLDGLNPQTVTLTITTTLPMASLQVPAGIDPRENSHRKGSTMLLASMNGMGVFGMFLAGNFNKKRNRWSVLAVLALAMSFFLVGCGGSSNSTITPPTKSNSASSVASSAATALVGQAVTFTGTVSANSGTPTGTVTFLDGTTTLGTGTLSSGKATYQTSSLAAGVHSITIAYGGDSNFNTSTSTALSETVDNATTSSVASSAATTLVGQAVTFTGTVSANSGTPTGTVTFLDGTTTLGTGTLSSGKATYQTSSLPAGVHSITIAYGGSTGFGASNSAALSQTVDNPGTATGTYTVNVSGSGTGGTNGVTNPNQSIGLTVIVQ